MESPLSFFRMHWDHEPTPNPSQEGNGQDVDERVLPSWEGSGTGRFMERWPRRCQTCSEWWYFEDALESLEKIGCPVRRLS